MDESWLCASGVFALLALLLGYRLRIPNPIDGGSALLIEDDGDWDAHESHDCAGSRGDSSGPEHEREPEDASDDDGAGDRRRVSDVFALFYFFLPSGTPSGSCNQLVSGPSGDDTPTPGRLPAK
jgi:hypothetical protein